jgi:peptidoglycan LD-endopeptidase CwlK
MINSRSLEDLVPPARDRAYEFLHLCNAAKIDVIVTSTYRDYESQNELYAQGRTKPGKIVTNARGGESFHNYRCAFDVVPVVNGKPDWDGSHPVWAQIGELGKKAGLEWAGDWVKFKELAHFQYTGGRTLQQLEDGATIE